MFKAMLEVKKCPLEADGGLGDGASLARVIGRLIPVSGPGRKYMSTCQASSLGISLH